MAVDVQIVAVTPYDLTNEVKVRFFNNGAPVADRSYTLPEGETLAYLKPIIKADIARVVASKATLTTLKTLIGQTLDLT